MSFGISLALNEILSVPSLNISAIQIFTADPYKFQKDVSLDFLGTINQLMSELENNSKVVDIVSHGSLITNMVSEKRNTRVFSANSMFLEILRCHDLNISTAVFHPGSSSDSDSIKLLAEGLLYTLNKVDKLGKSIPNICIENMVDSGHHIMTTPADYAELFQNISDPRIKICLDTCHCWGAGFTPKEFISGLDSFGLLDRLKVIHFNDSQVAYNSHKERHASLFHGTIPEEDLYWLVDFLKANPYIIAIEEQPKEESIDNVSKELNLIFEKDFKKSVNAELIEERVSKMISLTGKSLIPLNIGNLQDYLNLIVMEDKLSLLDVKFDSRANVKSSFCKLSGSQLTIYTGAILSEGNTLFSSEVEKLKDMSSILLFIVFFAIKKAIAKEDIDMKATSSYMSYIRMDADYENTYESIDKFIEGFKIKFPEGFTTTSVVIEAKTKSKKENPNKYKPLVDVPEVEIPDDLDLLSL